ncbi:MAG: putative type secretion system protein [Planctomycetota bacterium]
MMRHPQRRRPARRGLVTLVVIWAIAIASVIVASTQVLAFRQATLGREVLARTQARWAARAGVETMIAIMEWHTANPDTVDPMALTRDLESNALGEVETGTWDIRHFIDGQEWAGPLDEHAKLNINNITKATLLNIPNMTQDVADSIMDWRDTDHEVQGFGAERDYYRNRSLHYEPRNGDFRSIAELELVAGAWPQYVRGEDWNLNGRLDPNEDDGKNSHPDDRADGKLDAGWSGLLTATSRPSRLSPSGQERLDLRKTNAEDLAGRTGVDSQQAAALLSYARGGTANMGQILSTPLSQLSSSRRGAQPSNPAANTGSTGRSSVGRTGATGASNTGIKNLTPEQLRAVMNECMLSDTRTSGNATAGKLNLNTTSRAVLRDVLQLDTRFADAILSRRVAKNEGITSLADLVDLPGATQAQLLTIAQVADVSSSVYTIDSRGRSMGSSAEAEMVVVVDRSEVPAKILEYREP